jgi:hypothetical protein
MHIWTDLLAREAALLATLLAIGAAPAAFLSERFNAADRLALAPILGFCLGTCVATTVLEFAPAGQTYWMLIPLALLSLGVAMWRTRRSGTGWTSRIRLPRRELLQLLVVCVTVAGPLTYVLNERHTVGPVAYTYTDVDNYVAEQDAAQTRSIHQANEAWTESVRRGTRFADLTQRAWSFLSNFNGNLDAAPLDASLTGLLGLGASDTYSPFLIVLLLAGALGAFTAIRYLTRSRTWMAALAGALFGGPMFLELWFDSFQAAVVALSLVIPFAILSAETLRSRRVANLLLLALVLGCLFTVYPLFIPMLVATGALVLAWCAVAIHRRGGDLRLLVRPVATRIAALAALAIAFDPVGFTRNIHYYGKIIANTVPLPRVGWHLPIEVQPGWLLQTREFWYMPPLGTGGFKQVLLGALLPLVFIGFIVVGVRRHRSTLALVALAGICAIVAEYAYASREACTYCAERDLLPLAPIAVVLLALGLATMLAMPGRWLRVVGIAGVVLVVVAVGQRARVELTRFANGSYFLDSANRSALSYLPHNATAVELEGYGQTLFAQAEQPLAYHLANEYARGRVSIVLGSNLNNALEYLDFGPVESPGPEFHPGYDYVLTRFATIGTDRRMIARSGAIALEQRTQSLDVTPYAGLEAPLERLDTSGVAWLQPGVPLRLDVVGTGGRHVWAKLTFHTAEPLSVPPQPGVHARLRGSTLTACVATTGAPPVRQASLTVVAAPMAGPTPHEQFPPPVPFEGIALTSMRAVADRCTV